MECHVMEHPFFLRSSSGRAIKTRKTFAGKPLESFGVRWSQCFSMMKHNTIKMRGTPAKFNMEPENDGFQIESPFPGTSFQVPCEISGVYPFNKLRGKKDVILDLIIH